MVPTDSIQRSTELAVDIAYEALKNPPRQGRELARTVSSGIEMHNHATFVMIYVRDSGTADLIARSFRGEPVTKFSSKIIPGWTAIIIYRSAAFATLAA